MRGQKKGFFAGVITSLLVMSMIVTAIATVGTQTATLEYSNIKINLDGKIITPTNANGNAVEPFIINGTTYLPVRGLANALGLGVSWDDATQTVFLSSSGEPPIVNTPVPNQNTEPDTTIVNEFNPKTYLENIYATVETQVGTIKFSFRVYRNTSVSTPYDYSIDIEMKKEYFNRFSSITYTDEQKAAAKQELKDFTKKIADDITVKLEGKKIHCSYTHTYYDYPEIEVGFHQYKMLTWVNYSPANAKNYSDTTVTGFAWYPDGDLLSWR